MAVCVLRLVGLESRYRCVQRVRLGNKLGRTNLTQPNPLLEPVWTDRIVGTERRSDETRQRMAGKAGEAGEAGKAGVRSMGVKRNEPMTLLFRQSWIDGAPRDG